MLKNVHNNIFFIFIIIFFTTNCKIAEYAPQKTFRFIPDAFAEQKDTTNFAYISWRNYFQDSILNSLIDTALKNNFDVSIALQRIEMSRSQVRFAKGLALPFITGISNIGQRKFGQYTMDGIGNFDTNFSTNITEDQKIPEHLPEYYVGLQSTWEIDIWAKLKSMKKAALARYLSSIEGKNFVITNLVAEVAYTYYELLALDNELEIVKQTIILQENALKIINVQKQAGIANELAVQQFEALVLNSKGLEYEIRQQIVEFENRLNLLLGRFPQPIQRDKLSFEKSTPSQISAGLPTQLLKNRPDIRQAEYELLATGVEVYAAKSAFYPSLNLATNIGFQTFNAQFWLSPSSIAYNVLGGLVAPLLNRSQLKARLGIAKASQLEALYQYQKTVVNSYLEVANSLAKINNLAQILNLKNMEVQVLTEAIESSANLFRTGRASYLEVIITQANALQAKISLIEVKKRQYQSLVEVYRALGGGWQ